MTPPLCRTSFQLPTTDPVCRSPGSAMRTIAIPRHGPFRSNGRPLLPCLATMRDSTRDTQDSASQQLSNKMSTSSLIGLIGMRPGDRGGRPGPVAATPTGWHTPGAAPGKKLSVEVPTSTGTALHALDGSKNLPTRTCKVSVAHSGLASQPGSPWASVTLLRWTPRVACRPS